MAAPVRPAGAGAGAETISHPGAVALVLVDFDDTLVDTAPRFHEARAELFRVLEAAGFPPELARVVHHERVEPAMIERHGLGPGRLERSFRETYLRLCRDAGCEPDAGLADRCARISQGVAGPPPRLDGALDALADLARALPTALYTQAADPAYQLACIRAAGVLDVLPPDRVRIVARKTAEAFRATLEHFGVRDPASAWMVGNSIRSDINPALSGGARAILVEAPAPWEFDLVEPVSHDFLRVGTFAEAVAYLLGRRR